MSDSTCHYTIGKLTMCGADAIHMKCGGIAQAIFNTDRGIQGLSQESLSTLLWRKDIVIVRLAEGCDSACLRGKWRDGRSR